MREIGNVQVKGEGMRATVIDGIDGRVRAGERAGQVTVRGDGGPTRGSISLSCPESGLIALQMKCQLPLKGTVGSKC